MVDISNLIVDGTCKPTFKWIISPAASRVTREMPSHKWGYEPRTDWSEKQGEGKRVWGTTHFPVECKHWFCGESSCRRIIAMTSGLLYKDFQMVFPSTLVSLGTKLWPRGPDRSRYPLVISYMAGNYIIWRVLFP